MGKPDGVFAQPRTGLGTGIVKALAKQLDSQVATSSGPKGTSVSVTHATFAGREEDWKLSIDGDACSKIRKQKCMFCSVSRMVAPLDALVSRHAFSSVLMIGHHAAAASSASLSIDVLDCWAFALGSFINCTKQS
jgi:hypothetical protein